MSEVIIDKKDLLYNVNEIKKQISKDNYTIIAVVKGNGYGLDSTKLTNFLIDCGINTFAVAATEEAIKLRNSGIKEDIILLTPISDKKTLENLIDNKIILTIDSDNNAKNANEIANEKNIEVRAHVKIDTGLSRYGFKHDQNEKTRETLSKYKNIKYEGIYSHFSNSLAKDDSWSIEQYNRFLKTIDSLEENGFKFKLKHICNSSGFFKYPNMHLNSARIGSAFYGMAAGPDAKLKKIGKLHTKIARIREIEKGEFIGYANSFVAKKKMKIAIIPTGYFDGIGREILTQRFKLKSKIKKGITVFKNILRDDTLYLTVNGTKLKVIGQIGMHDIVLDITGQNFEENEDVYIDVRPVLIDSSVERIYK